MHAAVPEVRGHHCTNVCTDKLKVYSDKLKVYSDKLKVYSDKIECYKNCIFE